MTDGQPADRHDGYKDEPPKTKNPRTVSGAGVFQFHIDIRDIAVLGRPGSDLLSQALRLSTIGAEVFNGRVRDGIGFWALRRNHQVDKEQRCEFWFFGFALFEQGVIRTDLTQATGRILRTLINENDQANRAISTGKLHTLLRFHTRPIDVVVFHGSQGNARFEGGFLLRCIQQLSRPNLATLQCGWRHNRSTRGSSIPVLSY